jgi:hypothetical protein
MIGHYCFAQPELEVIVELHGGRMTALTDSYVPDDSMTFSERLFVAMRESTARPEELN